MGSNGIFKKMRRGGAKSCKKGLGRDNEIYFGRRITTNYIDGLRRRNNELNGFLGGEGLGRSTTTNFIIGLRRRNNELNELTNFLAARKGAKHCSSLCSQSEGEGYVANLSEIYCGLCGAAAPERGSYSRIGACPYLPPQLIDSRFCPCKGLISWAGLAPQQDSRYEPLTGARFINQPQEVGASPYPKYEPLSGRVFKIHIIFMSKLSPK